MIAVKMGVPFDVDRYAVVDTHPLVKELSNVPVYQPPPRLRDRMIGGIPDEVVHKIIGVDAVDLEDAAAFQLSEPGQKIRSLDAGQAPQQFQIELPARRSRPDQQILSVCAQSCELVRKELVQRTSAMILAIAQ